MHTAKGVTVDFPIAALLSCHGVQGQRSIHGLSAFTSKLGKRLAQPATPSGCPSCLLRMCIRMEKRGSEPGGQEGGEGVWGLDESVCEDAFRMGVHRGMSMSLSGFTAHSPSSWGILEKKREVGQCYWEGKFKSPWWSSAAILSTSTSCKWTVYYRECFSTSHELLNLSMSFLF